MDVLQAVKIHFFAVLVFKKNVSVGTHVKPRFEYAKLQIPTVVFHKAPRNESIPTCTRSRRCVCESVTT